MCYTRNRKFTRFPSYLNKQFLKINLKKKINAIFVVEGRRADGLKMNHAHSCFCT